MRALVQRVSSAHVDVVDAESVLRRVAELDRPGLLVFVGIGHDDGPAQVSWMADKLVGLRLLRDERSVVEAAAGILLVSQFTLLGDVRKGRRPTWSAAAPGDVAEPLVDSLATALRERAVHVGTGRFGADMRVHLINDGPTTLVIDTP